MSRLTTQLGDQSALHLGPWLPQVEAALADFDRRQVVPRIWNGDPTVWKPDPTEISNRLGWLTSTGEMRTQAPVLTSFAEEVRDSGFRHVVLLGMGGSSLGPEVLRQTFGSAPGYPELLVLDSTVPAWVQSVAQAIDPARTLFLVSSKSGSTTEPNLLYAYFHDLVEKAVGADNAGRNFIAVTDPGSPLKTLATQASFRRVFLNPPDIGGRFSVLSYFGLLPAALSGLNLTKLLDRADAMRKATGAEVPARLNPAAWLGLAMAILALRGRDKLTLVTSPSIAGFGLWVEQLIAESVGKEGRGIVPVVGESLDQFAGSPDDYGNDRLFVSLRLDGDGNRACDAAMQTVRTAGQPVVRLDLSDKYDLGAEFFRWELATAIAGSYLGINPFDQPNVQQAKDMTERVLGQFDKTGQRPAMEDSGSLGELLDAATQGDYLAIMAYLHQTPEVDQALDALRRKITEKSGIAVTVGYGPRFLHSTGQLHKGGPGSCLFLQLTADHNPNLAIPGTTYTFGLLADAQAAGDLEALLGSNRRAARVTLGPDPATGILRIAKSMD